MTTSASPAILRHFPGWMMVLAYLAGIQCLAPLAFVAVASLQHRHEISLSQENGAWRLELSHPDRADDRARDGIHAKDEHRFEIICNGGHHQGPAHVFCFAAKNSNALGTAGLSVPKVSLDAVLVGKLAAPEVRIYPVPVYLDGVAARPPPGKPAWLVCLRTTVLIV